MLKPHEAVVKRFLGTEATLRFATLDAAVAAMVEPDTDVDMEWALGVAPAQPVRKSINRCLHALARQSYEAMLTKAQTDGATLFTTAQTNTPATFVTQCCTYYYQGAYMAGDQFAVGAALKLEPTSRLILLYSDAEENAAKRLVGFYGTSCGLTAARLLLVKVADTKAACLACSGVVDARVSKVPPAIALPALTFLGGMPTIGGTKLCPVGGATTDVAASIMSGDGRGNVAKWDNVDPNGNSYWRYRVDKFLSAKNIAKTQKYVIVWTRFSGKDGGAHAELDDSWTGLGQVCHALLKKDLNVIVVGKPRNDRDLNTKLTEHLTALDTKDGAVARAKLQVWGEYWKQEDGGPNRKIIGPSRAAEYAIFLRMTQDAWGCKLVHLGMRSGAMDAAALLGMRTRFIENAGNQQIARTTKWTGGSNDNALYQRIAVSELSTRRARMMGNGTFNKAAHAEGTLDKSGVARGYKASDVTMIVSSVETALA
ncbi:hypothetical protein HX870_15295 [Pseudomonas gingeri]|uniref:hypothetical protein n=1 Tax=Pseudomonas gingeri TaxID=117681 RepID=UPI0015A21052|nr:hypothetical protein [Pseudomonas gingeri]NWD68964.1 hypothetical protein [Pseudomonas gingeri]